MTKPKTLAQLRAEKERAETQLAQEQHKLERLENRKKYLEKGKGATWNIKPPKCTIKNCPTNIKAATPKNKPLSFILWKAEWPLPNERALKIFQNCINTKVVKKMVRSSIEIFVVIKPAFPPTL